MKSILITITFFIITLCLAVSCSQKQDSIEVYSFSGGNETFAVNNGIIIANAKTEYFIGGDITFKSGEITGVKAYNTSFYYYKDGGRTDLLTNSASIQGSDEGMSVQSDLGSSSSESLFYGDDLELIVESLNFTLTGTFVNGESFEYAAVLNVKRVN